MPYQQHDSENDTVNPGALIDRNAYISNDTTNTPDNPQPGFTVATDDDSNSYKNWSADYVKRDINGSDLNPEVPIIIATESQLTGLIPGASRVQEEITGTLATFTGGVGSLVVEGKFMCKPVGGSTRDLSEWVECTEYSTADNQVLLLQPDMADKEVIFVTRAVDDNGITSISISELLNIYPIASVTSPCSVESGVYKVGEVIQVRIAEATGGLPGLNYLLQVRFSANGTSNWGGNITLVGNATGGSTYDYTITESDVGEYLQFRTRIRDNNNSGGSSIYTQIWSTAAGSSEALVADVVSSTGSATLSGEFRVNQTVVIESVPVFAGGLPPVVYQYQWQKSTTPTGEGWQGFDSPWVAYDPNTIIAGNVSRLLPAVVENLYIRLQTRAIDATGETVVAPGVVYGPVATEDPEAGTFTLVSAPFGALEGAYRVGEFINVTPATFTGGATPYTSRSVIIANTDGDLLQTYTGTELDSPISYQINHNDEGKFLYVSTVVVDSDNTTSSDTFELYNVIEASGAILPYEPALIKVQSTSVDRNVVAGREVQVTAATYDGGMPNQVYDLMARRYDDPAMTTQQEQVTIKSNATPGANYAWTAPIEWSGSYVKLVTRVRDNSGNDPFKQKFDFFEVGRV